MFRIRYALVALLLPVLAFWGVAPAAAQEGQPADPAGLDVELTQYQVQPGDTLSEIAAEQNSTLDVLLTANPELADNPDLIFPGQSLMVPADPQGRSVYVVQEGETLQSIANTFGVTEQEIIAANPLPDPNTLLAGQRLVIPVALPAEMVYTVQPGDTLIEIAERFGTTVEALNAANRGITDPDQIFVGQQIVIPETEMTTE